MWNLEVRNAGVIAVACVDGPLNTTVRQLGCYNKIP